MVYWHNLSNVVVKHERSINLKFAMGVIFTGQIAMFLFGESYIDEYNNNFIFNRHFLFSLS